ncbi:hypothetical protein H4R19_005072 [Coemansia spiralis]|nr:hypothetical protein H4R19_005072 [Coemansia spiralis]
MRSDTVQEKLVVADSIAGRLIGRNGKHLLSLEERSGARIMLSPRVKSIPDRIATVVGRPGDVRRACALIRENMREFADCGD